MSRRTFPSIRPSDLRDHADEARVARIWDRLEQDLAGREPTHARSAAPWVALVAATLGAFAAGVWVGTLGGAEHATTAIRATSPESSAAPDVLAAGTQQRSFTLPGGGTITLSPG